MKFNETLQRALLAQAVDQTRYENHVLRDIQKNWRASGQAIDKAIRASGLFHLTTPGGERTLGILDPTSRNHLNAIVDQIAAIIGSMAMEAMGYVSEALPAFAELELRQLPKIVNQHISNALKTVRESQDAWLADFMEYDPDQPRVPAGSPEGGEWASMGTQTTESALSEKDKKKLEAALTLYQLTRQSIHDELMRLLTSPDGSIDTTLIAQARHWYPDAHAWAQEIQGKANITLEQAIGVISAISPQNRWERDTQYGMSGNKIEALKVIQYFAEHGASGQSAEELAKAFKEYYNPKSLTGPNANHALNEPGIQAPTEMLTTAFSILLDGSHTNLQKELGTLKTASFYNNIMAPGKTRDVTVDGHMAKALVYAGRSLGIGTMPKEGPGPQGSTLGSMESMLRKKVWGASGHVLIADQVRAIADKLGESPDTIQAAYWLRIVNQGLSPWKTSKTVSEAELPSTPEHPFLLTVDTSMPWGDGPPLEEEDFDEPTVGHPRATPTLQETIVRVKGGYRIISHRTGKNLGTYKTRAQAQQALARMARFREAQQTLLEQPEDLDPEETFSQPFPESSPAILGRPIFRSVPEGQVASMLASPLGGTRYAQSFADLGTSLLTRVRNILMTGLIQGQGVGFIGKLVQGALGGAKYQAERIVRSEFVRTAAQADLQVYSANESSLEGVQWVATLDLDTCLQCAELDGEVWANPDDAPVPVDDTHPNCFLPGTRVSGSFLIAVRFLYSGRVITVRTQHGETLRVTPNHPILTTRGMLPAHELREGDNVIRCLRDRGDEHEQDMPAPIEEVFRTFQANGFGQPARLRQENFHGDAIGGQGQVDVVTLDRELLDRTVTAFAENRSDLGLEFSDEGELAHSGAGLSNQRDSGSLGATDRRMSSGDLSHPLAGIHARPFQLLRVGASTNVHAAFAKMRRERGATDDTFVRQLLERCPGLIALDQVIEIRYDRYTGHVYDLQSESGAIVAENTITSNCRCKLVPVVKNGEDLGFGPASRASMDGQVPATMTYQDWFDEQPEERQREILGPTRYNLYQRDDATLGDFVGVHGVKSVKEVLQDFAEARELLEADDCHWVTIDGNHICISAGHRHENSAGSAGGAMRTSRTVTPSASRTQVEPSQVSTKSTPSSDTTLANTPSTREGTTTTLGTIDPTSGKMILQPTDNLGVLKARATQALAPFSYAIDEIIKDIPGVENTGARIKAATPLGEARLTEKLHGRSPQTIGDYIGVRLSFPDDSGNALVEAIGNHYQIILDENFLNNPKAGYRARHLQVVLPQGITAEVQLVPREIAVVQEDAHKAYNVLRSATNQSTVRETAAAKSKAIFDTAWTKWVARTGYLVEQLEELRESFTRTLQEFMDRMLQEFRADQPRAPAGSAEGGQWVNVGPVLSRSTQAPESFQVNDVRVTYSRSDQTWHLIIGDSEAHVRLQKEYAPNTLDQPVGFGAPRTILNVVLLHASGPSRDTVKLIDRIKELAWAHGAYAIHAEVINDKLGALLQKLHGVQFKPAFPNDPASHKGTYSVPMTSVHESLFLEALVLAEYSPDEPRVPAGSPEGGQWTSGGGGTATATAPKIAHEQVLLDRLRAPDGGFTYSPTTDVEPTSGFAVSPYPDRSKVFDATTLLEDDLLHYVVVNWDVLSLPDHYLGAWHDPVTGKVFLDVSVVKSNEAEAKALALAKDQIAYFDLVNMKSIDVNREAKSGQRT